MTGPHREGYESSWKQSGATRHAVWHQQTPVGTVAVVFMEADRERVQDVHGIDLQSGPPPHSEQIHEHSF